MKKVTVLCVVLSLVTVLLFAACGPQVTPPAAGKVIKIGTTPDLTGPYSPIVTEIYRGIMMRFEDVNRGGGVDGVPLQLIWADTRSSPPVLLSHYNRCKEQGVLGMMMYTSTDATALLSFLNKDKIPATGYCSAWSTQFPPGYYFYAHENCFQGMTIGLTWLQEQLRKQGIDRPLRVATLGWDNPYGREALEPLAKWCPEHGMEIVASYWVAPTALDLTVPLVGIKAANPDAIMTIVNGGLCARDMGRVGFPENVTFWGVGMIEEAAYAELGGKEYFRVRAPNANWLAADYMPQELAEKRTTLYRELFKQDPPVTTYGNLSGWAIASIMIEAIGNAMDKVGYEGLTTDAIYQELCLIKDFDAGEGALVSYQDYPGDRTGQEDVRIWAFNVDKWKWEAISDWIKPPMHLNEYAKYYE